MCWPPAAWPQLLRKLCRLVAEVLKAVPGLQLATQPHRAAYAVLHLVKGLQLPVQSPTMPFELAQLLLFEFIDSRLVMETSLDT